MSLSNVSFQLSLISCFFAMSLTDSKYQCLLSKSIFNYLLSVSLLKCLFPTVSFGFQVAMSLWVSVTYTPSSVKKTLPLDFQVTLSDSK